MKRKRAAAGLPEALKQWHSAEYRDDLSAPFPERLGAWDEWYGGFTDWLNVRRAYIEQHFPDEAWKYQQDEPRIPAMPFHESVI